MRRVFALFAIGTLTAALTGCGGGGGEPTNIMEGVDQSAVDAYNAMLAADEAAMAEEAASGGTGMNPGDDAAAVPAAPAEGEAEAEGDAPAEE